MCLVNMWEVPPRPPDRQEEVGLSPPSESRLLQRRRSQQLSQSLRGSGYKAGDKVINMQVG